LGRIHLGARELPVGDLPIPGIALDDEFEIRTPTRLAEGGPEIPGAHMGMVIDPVRSPAQKLDIDELAPDPRRSGSLPIARPDTTPQPFMLAQRRDDVVGSAKGRKRKLDRGAGGLLGLQENKSMGMGNDHPCRPSVQIGSYLTATGWPNCADCPHDWPA